MLRFNVKFELPSPVSVPSSSSKFPYFPSAFYYYTAKNGSRIPYFNNVGTPEEQKMSLQIWYSMKSDELFTLETCYAQTNPKQLNAIKYFAGTENIPDGAIALSLKSGYRQLVGGSSWFAEDRFQYIISQMKKFSLDRFTNDFYRFPCAPTSDIYTAARLIEDYTRHGSDRFIRDYFRERGVSHLLDHSLDYYPPYYLFFLMTRYAAYPFSEAQIILAQERNKSQFDSPDRIFIDTIFEYEIAYIQSAIQVIELLRAGQIVEAGRHFGTSNPQWYRWGNEYLLQMNSTALSIGNIQERLTTLVPKFYTWKDIQIEELSRQLNSPMPDPLEHPTRYSYVETAAATLQKFSK